MECAGPSMSLFLAAPFEWKDEHPTLAKVADLSLEDYFASSVDSLTTFEEVDAALRTIANLLRRKQLSVAARYELALLRKAVAHHGYFMASAQQPLPNPFYYTKLPKNPAAHEKRRYAALLDRIAD